MLSAQVVERINLEGVHVSFLFGSDSDFRFLVGDPKPKDGETPRTDALKSSGVLEMLQKCGVIYDVSAISAHRHDDLLDDYCEALMDAAVPVVIASAGMSAAIGGAVPSKLFKRRHYATVALSVALPTPEFPDAMDALMACLRLPPGVVAPCCGIGQVGLKAAAFTACQILLAQGHARGFVDHALSSGKSPMLHAFTNRPAEPQEERDDHVPGGAC